MTRRSPNTDCHNCILILIPVTLQHNPKRCVIMRHIELKTNCHLQPYKYIFNQSSAGSSFKHGCPETDSVKNVYIFNPFNYTILKKTGFIRYCV